LQQHFSAPFRLLNTGDQIPAIGPLSTVLVVLRSQFLENPLHLVAIFISVVVPFVQDHPELEAWIGTTNPNTVPFAERYRFVESRVHVAVKYCPDLIIVLKRASAPPTAAPSDSFGPGSLHGPLGDGIRNSYAWSDFHRDQSAGTNALDRVEIRRFRVFSLAVQKESPLRLALKPAALQVRRRTFPTPMTPCH
jgi:hypothetical protein